MTYEEAEKLAFQIPWKIGFCNVGESCWCRTILPIEPIIYQHIPNGMDDEYYIIGDAAIDEELAEYIIKLHNNNLNEATDSTNSKQ